MAHCGSQVVLCHTVSGIFFCHCETLWLASVLPKQADFMAVDTAASLFFSLLLSCDAEFVDFFFCL